MDNQAEYYSGSEINSKPVDADLIRDLAKVINIHSRENQSNTPDFVLAAFLAGCLRSFEEASNHREGWFGQKLSIENSLKR